MTAKKLSKEYGVPREIVMAIGPDEHLVRNFISAARRHRNKVFNFKHELKNYDIEAITNIVGQDVADDIHLSSMGQINVRIIADYLTSLIM